MADEQLASRVKALETLLVLVISDRLAASARPDEASAYFRDIVAARRRGLVAEAEGYPGNPRADILIEAAQILQQLGDDALSFARIANMPDLGRRTEADYL